jgi:hypothetical protein
MVAATKIGKNAAECAQIAKIIASSALRLHANLQVFLSVIVDLWRFERKLMNIQ